MDDLPVCKKCCFCIPLRYGLLTWGYLKLITALKVLSFFIIIMIALWPYITTHLIIIIPITAILVTEIVVHIIFIVGAHKKNVSLLKVYYCYSWFMWVVTITMFIVCTALLLIAMPNSGGNTDSRAVGNNGSNSMLKSIFLSMDIIGFLLAIVIHTFLLFALRSEIIKLRSNCPYRFVKNDNDPEGALTTVNNEDEISKEYCTDLIYDKESSLL